MSNLPRGFRLPTGAAASEYAALHKFLKTRFADSVVLTFGQIEDLLGFALPDVARHQPEWWAGADLSMPVSSQARSWIGADRTARPNLLAGTVRFDRTEPRPAGADDGGEESGG